MVQRKKTTIKDIASHAGVSISTVSRALNNPETVTDEKRQAVLRAVDKLNYMPNIAAQGLASGQSMTIGVLTQYINSPHFGTLTRGVLQGLNNSDYSTIFADGSYDRVLERKIIHNLISRNVDGLIILEGKLTNDEILAFSKQIPTVVIGRSIEAIETQCIYIDQVDTAYRATQYLIDMGHRHIAHFIGIPDHKDAIDRKEGYLLALQDAGIIPDDNLLIQGDFLEQSGVLGVETLISRGTFFSAIFASNDQMAYGARLALFRHGLRVPEDISLIGFDDLTTSAFVTPPLTTVAQPALEMGIRAAEMMVDLLAGKTLTRPDFSGDLIVRESVVRNR